MSYQSLLVALLDKQEQLTKRILAIEADFKKGRSQDFSEQTTETENDQVLDGIHHEAKIELKQVDEAIRRIHENTYGICNKCEEAIAIERLKALPYVNTCILCAE